MRFIDYTLLEIPDNWLVLARNELGNQANSPWSYLKLIFEGIVGKKCWYSESLNVGADNDLDHFRPKGQQVKSLTSKFADLEEDVWQQVNIAARIGYQFMQFESINYRYACTFVNSPRKGSNGKTRGKSNFFPLKNDSSIASDLANIENEVFCLLDPCKENDVELMQFNSLGEIEPNKSIEILSWDYCRVKVSVEVYHLHYYLFRDSRIEVWNQVKEHIILADELKPSNIAQQQTNQFKYHIKKLAEKIKKIAEYSAVAIDCIRFYKGEYPWLNVFFPDATLKK